MSDLISRRGAMMETRPEYLNPNQKGHEEYNKAWNDGIKAYWNALKELPSELAWIPCSERLPEKDGYYLVTLEFDYGKEIEMGWLLDGEWVNENSHVTVAWMPLPEVWKDDGE